VSGKLFEELTRMSYIIKRSRIVMAMNDKASLLIAIGCYGDSSDLFYNIGFGRIDSEMLASPYFAR
jgi:hypothetical protein